MALPSSGNGPENPNYKIPGTFNFTKVFDNIKSETDNSN